jgi:hypothetical protein
MGTASVGFGCLTGFGDQALVLLGLGFLAVGLVFQGVTFDRARRLARASVALRLVRSGRAHLSDGDEHPHAFDAGTWVEFWSSKDPAVKLAQSPAIFNPIARVVLRRCIDLAHVDAGARFAPEDLRYHVEVE